MRFHKESQNDKLLELRKNLEYILLQPLIAEIGKFK